jgi:hypothetical protein
VSSSSWVVVGVCWTGPLHYPRLQVQCPSTAVDPCLGGTNIFVWPVRCSIRLVRAPSHTLFKLLPTLRAPHTYLDGIDPFTYLGVWAMDALHSTATLSIQSVAVACMGVSPHALSQYFPVLLRPLWLGRLPFCRASVLTLTLGSALNSEASRSAVIPYIVFSPHLKAVFSNFTLTCHISRRLYTEHAPSFDRDSPNSSPIDMNFLPVFDHQGKLPPPSVP